MEPLLKLDHIVMQFGGVRAVDDLEIVVNPGEIVALIGPNGAGKTTAFNVVTGVYKPTSGGVSFAGRDITGLSPDKITAAGIARTFQNIRLFKKLTVYDNVLIAHHLHFNANFFDATFRSKKARAEEKRIRQETDALLRDLGLWEVRHENSTSLPYGQQRKLEIARALATKPQLLLLDEPAAGMNPQETMELTDFIRDIRTRYQLTVFMIEHHMDLVMDSSDRIYVLNFGELIAAGTPAEIQNNPKVIEAYLGTGEDDDAEN